MEYKVQKNSKYLFNELNKLEIDNYDIWYDKINTLIKKDNRDVIKDLIDIFIEKKEYIKAFFTMIYSEIYIDFSKIDKNIIKQIKTIFYNDTNIFKFYTLRLTNEPIDIKKDLIFNILKYDSNFFDKIYHIDTDIIYYINYNRYMFLNTILNLDSIDELEDYRVKLRTNSGIFSLNVIESIPIDNISFDILFYLKDIIYDEYDKILISDFSLNNEYTRLKALYDKIIKKAILEQNIDILIKLIHSRQVETFIINSGYKFNSEIIDYLRNILNEYKFILDLYIFKDLSFNDLESEYEKILYRDAIKTCIDNINSDKFNDIEKYKFLKLLKNTQTNIKVNIEKDI